MAANVVDDKSDEFYKTQNIRDSLKEIENEELLVNEAEEAKIPSKLETPTKPTTFIGLPDWPIQFETKLTDSND